MLARTLGALLGLSVVLSATPALACEPTLIGLKSGSPHVAPDGALSLLFSCGTEVCPADARPRFRVLDEAGNELPGSVIKSGVASTEQWAVWRPTQPFAANARFTVEQQNGQSVSFDSSGVSFDPKTLQVSFSAEASDVPAGDEVCCDPSPNTMFCYGRRSCFQKRRQGAVNLSLTAYAPTGFDVLYRATFRSGDVTTVLPDQASFGIVHVSHTAATSYCYSLDAVRVATDEIIHVADGCQALALPSLAVRAPNDVELRTDLGQCSHAPAGYEADWTRLGLKNAPFVTSGDAAVEMSTPDAGAVSGGASIDDTTEESGCALAGGSAVGGAWSALLALALLLRRRRV